MKKSRYKEEQIIVSRLPRRQRAKIIEMVESLVDQHRRRPS